MGAIPALTNSSVGSPLGTIGNEGTMVWPRSLKKSRNDCRMLAVVQRIARLFYPSGAKLPTVLTARERQRRALGTTDARRRDRDWKTGPRRNPAESLCHGSALSPSSLPRVARQRVVLFLRWRLRGARPAGSGVWRESFVQPHRRALGSP